MKIKFLQLLFLFISFLSISAYADTYNPSTVYYKNQETTITINGTLITIVYINDSNSSLFSNSTPYDVNNGWLWSISKNYTGNWVSYHYVVFPDKKTIVTYNGKSYELKQELWPSAPSPDVAASENWGWTCLNCTTTPVTSCQNPYSTDYFPILLSQQNNGNDNTTPSNASGSGGIIPGQGGNFININQVRKCNTPLVLYNNDILLRDGCDPHAGLGYYGISDNTNVAAPQKRLFADYDTDGPVLYGWNGGALGIRQRTNLTATNGPHIEKIALQWTPSEVRIGTVQIPMPLVTYDVIKHTNITDGNYGMIFTGSNNSKIIAVNNSSTNQPVFRLSGSGELRTKKIWAESIEVVASVTWPDYVFSKNYNLLSLQEVENYINKNNHLPNVPSQNEVQQNGINIAEMNATLLQKVEELTLYIIEQQKMILQLQSDMNQLKK